METTRWVQVMSFGLIKNLTTLLVVLVTIDL
jgi:hypothetical protein